MQSGPKIIKHSKTSKPQPFVKWAGGKTRIAPILISYLPKWVVQGDDVCYVEPFVGGGGLLFNLLDIPGITNIVINDVNSDLIKTYDMVKNKPNELCQLLDNFNIEFGRCDNYEARKHYYLIIRDKYNSRSEGDEWQIAAFYFLNHTCFNGLYRENAQGLFNVPYGKYKALPKFRSIIEIDSCFLKKVDLQCGDFNDIKIPIGNKHCFFYLDPPYRPLADTTNFNTYHHSGFVDDDQHRLKVFCDNLTHRNIHWMMSNSYSIDSNGESFFERLYDNCRIVKIEAPRYINAHVQKRKLEKELLIMNYDINGNLLDV